MSNCNFMDCAFRARDGSCTMLRCVVDPETIAIWREEQYERQQRTLSDILDMREEKRKEGK